MITCRPRICGVLGVVGDRVGIAVRGHDAHLVVDAALLELLGRGLHRRHVALGAHDDADQRRVDLEAVELGLDRPPRVHRGCVLAHAAMSRRSCRPSNVDHVGGSIRALAGGLRAVAERGHVEHAAAGGDDRAVALARCPRA